MIEYHSCIHITNINVHCLLSQINTEIDSNNLLNVLNGFKLNSRDEQFASQNYILWAGLDAQNGVKTKVIITCN